MRNAKDCLGCGTSNGFAVPFTMAFQPVVDISARRIYAHEALVRGVDGASAASILEAVTPETRYSFDQDCRVKAIELAASLGLDRRLNVNFMPNAVYEPEACIRRTLATATKVGFPLDRITFEITEDERIADHAHLRKIITEYRAHGFCVALDDFGSGYAGLNVLADLMPDVVKLDRAVIHRLDQDPVRRSIALGMIRVCFDIGIDVVAEGVETPGELSVLSDSGVTRFQGFLFAKPAFEKLLTEADIEYFH